MKLIFVRISDIFRYNLFPSATVLSRDISQEKGDPNKRYTWKNADKALLNKNASMVDSRDTSDPAEIQLNLEKYLTTLFLHMTEHSNLSVSSELKP